MNTFVGTYLLPLKPYLIHLNIFVFALFVASAVLWIRSAWVDIPAIPSSRDDPNRASLEGLDQVRPLSLALNVQARWNFWAALLTGLAVASQGIVALLGYLLRGL
jgi:hypothetical protein